MKALTSDALGEWLSQAYLWLTTPVFTVGESSLSVANILKLVFFLLLVFVAARIVRRWLAARIFPRFSVEEGLAEAMANIVNYVLIVAGLMLGLQTVGVEMSTIAVVFGALGIGVGFGLQAVVANFVSGVIILLERPVQVGDRIQIGELHGRVTRIRFRATEVLTNDNIAVIVPNSDFITQRVVNWSRGGNNVRIRVPVPVAYGSDVETVRRALLEAAGTLDVVLKDPPPEVRFVRFGDSSLDFELLGWTSELLHRRGAFISRVNYAVHESLAKHGLHVPFPQRDVHLRWAPGSSPREIGPGTPS